MRPKDSSKHQFKRASSEPSVPSHLDHEVRQCLIRQMWRMIVSSSTLNPSRMAWRFQKKYLGGFQKPQVEEESRPRYTGKFWKKIRSQAGVFSNPRNSTDIFEQFFRKRHSKEMRYSQLCKLTQGEICAQSLQSQQLSRKATLHTGGVNKQSSSLSTPWPKSQSRGKYLSSGHSELTKRMLSSGAGNTPTQGSGYSVKSSAKNSIQGNRNNFNNQYQELSLREPVHTNREIQAMQPMHHHHTTLPEIPKNTQEEADINPGGEVEGEGHTPNNITHQINRAELGPPWRKKRSNSGSGGKTTEFCERMEEAGRSVGIQADQMGLEATVQTDEPANSISKFPKYSRGQDRHTRICRQRGCGKSRENRQCAFFLCGSSGRKGKTDSGLFAFEQAPNLSTFQDGEHEIGYRLDQKQRLADQNRYQGRISTCTTARGYIAPTRDSLERWIEVGIQGNAFWSQYCSTSIYEVNEVSLKTTTQGGDSASRLLGRHIDNFGIQRTGSGEFTEDRSMVTTTRVSDKLQEVKFMSHSEDRISGHDNRYMQDELECASDQSMQSATRSAANIVQKRLARSEVSSHDWTNEFHLQCNVSRHADDSLPISESHRIVKGKRIRLGQYEGDPVGRVKRRVGMVDGGNEIFQRSSICPSSHRANNLHGCIGARMGWRLWDRLLLGIMDRFGIFCVIKYERIDSYPQSNPSFGSESQEQETPNSIGQHHCNCECSERGRQQQCRLHSTVERPVLVDETIELHSGDAPHPWQKQHFRRCGVSPKFQRRIQSQEFCIQSNFTTMGKTIDRPVRDKRESHASEILLMESGPKGTSDGCICPALVQGEITVCPSSDPTDSESHSKMQRRTGKEFDISTSELVITPILANTNAAQEGIFTITQKLLKGPTQSSLSDSKSTDDSVVTNIPISMFLNVPLDREEYLEKKHQS